MKRKERHEREALVLRVEVAGGVSIEWAAEDLVRLATRLHVSVETRFNNIWLYAAPGEKPTQVVREYNNTIRERKRA